MATKNVRPANDESNSKVPATREEGTGKQEKSRRAQQRQAQSGGMVGGPATDSVPGSNRTPADIFEGRTPAPSGRSKENDGGESTLSGQPRETGGDRPK